MLAPLASRMVVSSLPRAYGHQGAQCQKCQKPLAGASPRPSGTFGTVALRAYVYKIGACEKNCVSTADWFPCHLDRLAGKYLLTLVVSTRQPSCGTRPTCQFPAHLPHACQIRWCNAPRNSCPTATRPVMGRLYNQAVFCPVAAAI